MAKNKEEEAAAAAAEKKAKDEAARAEKKAKDLLIKNLLKALEELCGSKFPKSKKYDKFWVGGSVTRTFKVADKIQYIIEEMSKLPEGSEETLASNEDAWKLVMDVIEAQKNMTRE